MVRFFFFCCTGFDIRQLWCRPDEVDTCMLPSGFLFLIVINIATFWEKKLQFCCTVYFLLLLNIHKHDIFCYMFFFYIYILILTMYICLRLKSCKEKKLNHGTRPKVFRSLDYHSRVQIAQGHYAHGLVHLITFQYICYLILNFKAENLYKCMY